MPGLLKDAVRIPSIDELNRIVVPSTPRECATGLSRGDPRKPHDIFVDDAGREYHLTPEAERFLRHAAESHHRSLTLGERWTALGIASGSVQKRILNELHRHGLIRLERKGKVRYVHLYGRAYEYLGIPRPTSKGVGGTSHRIAVERMAAVLKERGYEVHIEREVGTAKKRVDLVAYAKDRILGVEVGLSDVRQEIKNLREDLETGVLDLVLFVSTDPTMLAKVKAAAGDCTDLRGQLHRIKFFLLDEGAGP